jgi:hypothetical protein
MTDPQGGFQDSLSPFYNSSIYKVRLAAKFGEISPEEISRKSDQGREVY